MEAERDVGEVLDPAGLGRARRHWRRQPGPGEHPGSGGVLRLGPYAHGWWVELTRTAITCRGYRTREGAEQVAQKVMDSIGPGWVEVPLGLPGEAWIARSGPPETVSAQHEGMNSELSPAAQKVLRAYRDYDPQQHGPDELAYVTEVTGLERAEATAGREELVTAIPPLLGRMMHRFDGPIGEGAHEITDAGREAVGGD